MELYDDDIEQDFFNRSFGITKRKSHPVVTDEELIVTPQPKKDSDNNLVEDEELVLDIETNLERKKRSYIKVIDQRIEYYKRQVQRWERKKEKFIKKMKYAPFVIHNIDGNQFNFANGRTACTAISLCAVAEYLTSKKTPTSINWIEIILRGAEVWKTWKDSLVVVSHDTKANIFPLVHELLSLESVKSLTQDIVLLEEIGGSVNYSSFDEDNKETGNYYIRDALDKIEKIDSVNVGVTLTIDVLDITISLYVDDDNKWFLYDSHGIKSSGSNESSLIEFNRKDHVADFIIDNYCETKSNYLYSICVFVNK